MDKVRHVGKPNQMPRGGHKPALAQIRAILQKKREERIAQTPTEYDIVPIVYLQMDAREYGMGIV